MPMTPEQLLFVANVLDVPLANLEFVAYRTSEEEVLGRVAQLRGGHVPKETLDGWVRGIDQIAADLSKLKSREVFLSALKTCNDALARLKRNLDESEQFEGLLRQVSTRLDELARVAPREAVEIRRFMDAALTPAERGEYETAFGALNELAWRVDAAQVLLERARELAADRPAAGVPGRPADPTELPPAAGEAEGRRQAEREQEAAAAAAAERAAKHAAEFQTAFEHAKQEFLRLKPNLRPCAAAIVQKDMLDAAAAKASSGDISGALKLVERAKKYFAERILLAAEHMSFFTRELGVVEQHAQSAEFTPDIERARARLTGLGDAMGECLERVVGIEVSMLHRDLVRLLQNENLHGKFVAAHKEVKALHRAAVASAPESFLTIARATLDSILECLRKASLHAAHRAYELAERALSEARRCCEEAIKLRTAHTGLIDEIARLKAKVKALPTVFGASAEGEAAVLRKLLTQAGVAATEEGGFEQASALVADVARHCEVADRASGVSKRMPPAVQGIKADLHGGWLHAPAEALAMARGLVEELDKWSRGRDPIPEKLAQFKKLIHDGDAWTSKRAPALFDDAIQLYLAAAQELELQDAYDKRRCQSQSDRAALGSAYPFVVQRLLPVEALFKKAEKEAGKHRYLPAIRLLDEASQAIKDIQAHVARFEQLAASLSTLKSDFELSETSAPPADAQDTDRLRGWIHQLDERQRMPEVDLDEFDELFRRAEALCQRLKTRWLTRAGDAPEVVKQQLADFQKRYGLETLDSVIGADYSAMPSPNLALAIQLRFGLRPGGVVHKENDSEGEKREALGGLYAAMTLVPTEHTLGNPYLQGVILIRRGEGTYSAAQRTITLVTGESGEVMLGDRRELPHVLKECQPLPKDPDRDGISRTIFGHSALHEIGHSVDELKKFMERHMGEADFAAWKAHGSDLLGVAKAVASEFGIDGLSGPDLAKYMAGGELPAIPMTDKLIVRRWFMLARHGEAPWENGEACGKPVRDGGLLVGGRIFHQGYEGQWFSYDAGARRRGITGYQFRSPSEWFAELYAAFVGGALKDAHPSRTWLEELFAGGARA